ncbi:hypothetical protein MKEN_01491000 [Mycena kentingensis (nom. inval.)]|nr:hypothetical protein MKEN_01491000 [Mycena kentingensis (nom. inval.)]
MRSEHFEVWIHIDGQRKPATEYRLTESEDNGGTTVLSCYIASERGKKFSVRWKNKSYTEHESISYNIFVDGKNVDRTQMTHDDEDPLPAEDTIPGITSVDGKTIRPFMFSPLQLTDEDDESEDDDLGVIEVNMWPVEVEESNPRYTQPALPQLVVSEKKKKARTEQVSVSAPVHVPAKERSRVIGTKFIGSVVMRFRFTYYPLEVLRAAGIAPPPAPPPRRSNRKRKTTEEDSDVNQDDDDDERQAKKLRQQLAALETDQSRRIRAELAALEARMGSGNPSRVSVKREQEDGVVGNNSGAEKRRRATRSSGSHSRSAQVIDLTQD